MSRGPPPPAAHGPLASPAPSRAAAFVKNETLSLIAITIFKQTNGSRHYIQNETPGR